MQNNLLDYVEDKEKSEFYPTPKNLVKRMLSGIDLHKVSNILEPSAGKGDIIAEVLANEERQYNLHIDCIEIDPNLRAIIKQNFNDSENVRIVHDDFLSYTPYRRYDWILMNPPFSDGAKHLLKAIDLQKYGGGIVCLLNAETIRNPYTEERKHLLQLLDEYDAEIEYVQNGFAGAERKTGVEVALIRANIPKNDPESSIYDRMEKTREYADPVYDEEHNLEVADLIQAAVNRYRLEVEAGIELIRTFERMKPHLQDSLDETNPYRSSIIELTIGGHNGSTATINAYVKAVRFKYWSGLLSNAKIVGKLTSKLQEQYRRNVAEYAEYDFSEFNIRQLIVEMDAQIRQGIEEECIEMFDRLTQTHAWYPECSNNRYLYSGWKTNLAWKIGKKSILPTYGIFSNWSGEPNEYQAYEVLSDIERVLNFFAGNMTAGINLAASIQYEFRRGNTKNIHCKYFTATFYKKGTVHLVYNCPELIDRFNIYAAQNKRWLPPSYGKKAYADMDAEEKAIIDSFQGEEAYNRVLKESSYYLKAPSEGATKMLALAG